MSNPNNGSEPMIDGICWLLQAARFVEDAHKLKISTKEGDGNQTPYISEIGSGNAFRIVCSIIDANVRDVDTICAAFLINIFEDTDCSYKQVSGAFGENIALIVAECSRNRNFPKAVNDKLLLLNASGLSISAKVIKLAEILDNISNMETEIPSSPRSFQTFDSTHGYIIWAYKLWDTIKDANPKLNSRIAAIFEKWNINKLSEKEIDSILNGWYECNY